MDLKLTYCMKLTVFSSWSEVLSIMAVGRPARVLELVFRRSFVFSLSSGWLFVFGPAKVVLQTWMQPYSGVAQLRSSVLIGFSGPASGCCFGCPWCFADFRYFDALEWASTLKKEWAGVSVFWLVIGAVSILTAQCSIFTTDWSWLGATVCSPSPSGCSVWEAPASALYYWPPLWGRSYS